MQYDSYRERMKRIAGILGRLYARRLIISVALAVLTVVIAAAVMTKGLLVMESDCPAEVVYGEKLGYRAYFMTGLTTYEYRGQGSEGWSTEKPIFPGQYQVRAYGKTASGARNYTEVHDFTILPREITLQVKESSIEYGETPTVTAKLAKGDQLSCSVAYTEWGIPSTTAYPDLSTLTITDKKGDDRLAGYTVTEAVRSPLQIRPRPLTVTVQNASKVYDDTPLSYDGYEVSGGSVLAGDRLVAVFRDTLTNAGSKENTPTLRVFDSRGLDVTALYSITVKSGKLTVDKRPLVVQTESAAYTYNGRALEHRGYSIDPTTPPADGHYLAIQTATTLLDCGQVENVLTFTVHNRRGVDETQNYSLFVKAGTLTVNPREVTVHTQSGTLVYDGTDQTYPYATVENGVGDEYRVMDAATIRDVGEISNRLTVEFYRGDKNITSNYVIKGYTYGRITVERRPIHVVMADDSKIYDGTPLTAGKFTVVSSGTGYGLAKGHSLSLKAEGSVLFGTSENRYVAGSARIHDAAGKDVSHNYLITTEDGTLTVEPRPLVLSSPGATKVYDGLPLSDSSWRIASGSLLEGHELSVVLAEASITDVGSVDNLFRHERTRVTDTRTGEDVTQYYAIRYAEGTLEVTPRPITVRTESSEWMYDGKTHEGSTSFELTEGTLVAGHTLIDASSAPVTILNAGKVENRREVRIVSDAGDQTHNYRIRYEYGYLTVTPRPITVRAGSLTVIYDGKPHTAADAKLDVSSPNSLVTGHTLQVQSQDQLFFTMAGSFINSPKISVYDSNAGIYVTPNYRITLYEGVVTIEKRTVHIQINGESVYDGLPMDDWRVDYLGATSLAEGHTLTISPESVPTNAGTLRSSLNSNKLTITDTKGESVRENYVLKWSEGNLTVLPRPISLQTASAEKVYDGLPLTDRTVTVTADSLPMVDGHEPILMVLGQGTQVGVYPNTYNPKVFIVSANGLDVTRNYELVSVTEGTLTVKHPAVITVATGSASKEYDGLPLTHDEYTVSVSRGTLPDGYTVDVEVTGWILLPDSTPNTAAVTVRDPNGEDVTALFTVELRLGVLTVTDNDAAFFGRVYADLDGLVYLRMSAFGDYNGRGWDAAVSYNGTLSGGYSLNLLPAAVLANLGISQPRTLRFEGMRSFMLPYYTQIGGTTPVFGGDTDYAGHPLTGYEVSYYPVEDVLSLLTRFQQVPSLLKPLLLGSYADAEKSYRGFVYGQYLSIDQETLTFMRGIIAEQGFSASDASVIADVAAYIQQAAKYDLHYDRALDGEANMAVAFLRDYREGVCVHYATAATLLYRALGIPARYVTGFMMPVKGGQWNQLPTAGHAWVEVYVDSLGWVQVEVTGSDDSGDSPDVPTIDVRPVIELMPAFAHKTYDGAYLYAPDELVLTPSLKKLLDAGYTYKVTVSGTQLKVGDGISYVSEFTLYDPKGTDVTDGYRLDRCNGLLRVTAASAEVFLYPLHKTYDGRAAVWEAGDYRVLGLPEGCRLELTVTLPADRIGYITLSELNRDPAAYAAYRILRGNTDVTASYSLVFTLPEGTAEQPVLTVSQRALELTAASETRLDTGLPLANATVYITKGSLIPGHTLYASAVGSQIGAGSCPNRVDVKNLVVRDGAGNDVTSLYSITCVNGELVLLEDASS